MSRDLLLVGEGELFMITPKELDGSISESRREEDRGEVNYDICPLADRCDGAKTKVFEFVCDGNYKDCGHYLNNHPIRLEPDQWEHVK